MEFNGINNLIALSKKLTGRGLIISIEGVEGVGKTTCSKLLHDKLKINGIDSRLLIDYYERTDKTGPLIAAITENPNIEIFNDLTLFFLYCARLNDKVNLAIKVSNEADIVIIDRLDISLQSRAIWGWKIEKTFVQDILKAITLCINVQTTVSYLLALDASDEVRNNRIRNSKKFRRRDLLSYEINNEIRNGLINLCNDRGINIIDTSFLTEEEVLEQMDTSCVIFYNKLTKNS